MKYFNETNIDTIGDWDGRESDVAKAINKILDKIDDMVIEKYNESNIIIENVPEMHNLVWDYVCNKSDNVFEMTDNDYKKAAEYAFAFIEVYEVGE